MQLTSVLLALNSFHKYEKLTTEIEKDNTIFFLDILIRRKPGKNETTVYRKKTCTVSIWIGVLLHLKVGNEEL